MNAAELQILSALKDAADACMDDIKLRGSLRPYTAAHYRICRRRAEDLIVANPPPAPPFPEHARPRLQAAVAKLRKPEHSMDDLNEEPTTHPACKRVQIEDAVIFEEPPVYRCENFDQPKTHIYAPAADGGVVCCCGGKCYPVDESTTRNEQPMR